MPDKDETERLLDEQARREQRERKLAQDAPAPAERREHERRSEKADYLREKLEQQAESLEESQDS